MAVRFKATFKPNYSGIAKLAVSEEIKVPLREVIAKAVSIAREIAAPLRDTGDYAEHFGTVEYTQRDSLGRNPKNRAVVAMTNDSVHATVVEYGRKESTAGSPLGQNKGYIGYRVFGRTKDQLQSG